MKADFFQVFWILHSLPQLLSVKLSVKTAGSRKSQELAPYRASDVCHISLILWFSFESIFQRNQSTTSYFYLLRMELRLFQKGDCLNSICIRLRYWWNFFPDLLAEVLKTQFTSFCPDIFCIKSISWWIVTPIPMELPLKIKT